MGSGGGVGSRRGEKMNTNKRRLFCVILLCTFHSFFIFDGCNKKQFTPLISVSNYENKPVHFLISIASTGQQNAPTRGRHSVSISILRQVIPWPPCSFCCTGPGGANKAQRQALGRNFQYGNKSSETIARCSPSYRGVDRPKRSAARFNVADAVPSPNMGTTKYVADIKQPVD